MNDLYLLVTIADTPVAIPTVNVEAVVRMGALTPVPAVGPQVAGLATLRSRVLTILDVARLIDPKAPARARDHAIICDIAGHSYGMLVDEVRDISEIDMQVMPLRGRTSPAWKSFAVGSILQDGAPYLVVPLENFVEPPVLGQAA